VLHARDRIPAGRFGVNRRRHIGVGPFGPVGAQDLFEPGVVKAARVAVVAVLQRQRSPVQQTLAAGALGDPVTDSAGSASGNAGQFVEGAEGQRFLVNGVSAE